MIWTVLVALLLIAWQVFVWISVPRTTASMAVNAISTLVLVAYPATQLFFLSRPHIAQACR